MSVLTNGISMHPSASTWQMASFTIVPELLAIAKYTRSLFPNVYPVRWIFTVPVFPRIIRIVVPSVSSLNTLSTSNNKITFSARR